MNGAHVRGGDTLADPCPKLGGLGGHPHYIREGQTTRVVKGRNKTRCVYCGRTLDLGPALGQLELLPA